MLLFQILQILILLTQVLLERQEVLTEVLRVLAVLEETD
jgi:hypothetical protein